MNSSKILACLAPKRISRRYATKLKTQNFVKDAEKVVGYPTSFLNLRWILSDEIANIASHLPKLIATNHPLVETAKNLLFSNDTSTWGLIVLLVAKSAGHNSSFPELECDITAGILHSQRTLAEVTEMIRTSHLMHKGMVNVDADSSSDVKYGNNLALLCGDGLLAKSFEEVARLRNYKVQETISSTLRDLSESQMIGVRDKQNNPLPSKPNSLQEAIEIPNEYGGNPFQIKPVLGNMKAEWTLRNILGGASLLGKGCQCSLMVANHDEALQRLAYQVGRNVALAWQARTEKAEFEIGDRFNLTVAPVMFHLEADPELYRDIVSGAENVNDVDFDAVKTKVLNGPGIERTVQVQEEFSERALEALHGFDESDSKTALVNLIRSM